MYARDACLREYAAEFLDRRTQQEARAPFLPLLLCSKHVIHDRDTTIGHVLPVGSNIYPFYLEHRRKTILGLR